jgi:hypothetical protein
MKTRIEHVSRSVIENKLLAALDDETGKVAILATENDLDLIVAAFTLASLDRMAPPGLKEMLDDLKKLQKGAFGK